jgi:uncharacterized protein with GYD domain
MTKRYILLLRWTEQGIRNFKDTIKHAEAAKIEAKRLAVNVHHIGHLANMTV